MRARFAPIVAIWFTIACSDSTGPEIVLPDTNSAASIADFANTWVASSWEITSLEKTDQMVEVISMGGRWIMQVETDGRYTIDFSSTLADGVTTGTVTLSGDTLLTFDDDANIFQFTGSFFLQPGSLRLVLARGMVQPGDFGFTGSGGSVGVLQVIEMTQSSALLAGSRTPVPAFNSHQPRDVEHHLINAR